MPLPDLNTAQQVIEVLEQYHASQEADAMDYTDCAKWHGRVSKWLRMFALKNYQQAVDYEDSEAACAGYPPPQPEPEPETYVSACAKCAAAPGGVCDGCIPF